MITKAKDGEKSFSNISSRVKEELGEDMTHRLIDFFQRGDEHVFFHNLQFFFFKQSKEIYTWLKFRALLEQLLNNIEDIKKSEKAKNIASEIAGKIMGVCLGIYEEKKEQFKGQENIIYRLKKIKSEFIAKQDDEKITGNDICGFFGNSR